MQQQVRTLCFARPGLPRNHNTLVLPRLQHGVIGGISDGKNVRRQLAQPFVLVHLDILGVVDGEELERVDGDQDGANIRVDLGAVEPVESEQRRSVQSVTQKEFSR